MQVLGLLNHATGQQAQPPRSRCADLAWYGPLEDVAIQADVSVPAEEWAQFELGPARRKHLDPVFD